MPLLTIASPRGSARKAVDVMYPALTVSIHPGQAPGVLRFEHLHDDLDELEMAYLEADGIPVVFQRRPPEPVDVYTVYVDAEGLLAEDLQPLEFLRGLLATLRIDGPPLWVSDQLARRLPRVDRGRRLAGESSSEGRTKTRVRRV